MKLVYLHTNPISSNQANIIQVLYMCDALAEQGIEVELIVPNNGISLSESEKNTLVEQRIYKKRKFHINEYNRSTVFSRARLIGNYLGLRKKLLNTEADIYFSRTTIILPLLKKLNKKIIFESHSPLLQNTFRILDNLYKSSLYKQMKSNKKLVMVTISSALKKYWIDKSFDHSRIFVLHDAFDDSQIINEEECDKENKNSNLYSDKIVITYIGSLYQDRGIERLFDLSEKFNDCQFLVAGGPEKEKKLYTQEARRLGLKNLIFLGWLDRVEVNKLLVSSDILLMLWSKNVPTINYCSPMKVFEYMSSGKIIVGDGFPTIKEVLTDGLNAHLSIPECNKSLISKIELAISQINDDAMGQKAKSLAYEKYTWKNRALEIRRIIDNIH